MLIRDIALTAAEMVGDSAVVTALGDGIGEKGEKNAAVKLMLTSVLSALPRVAEDFPAPTGAGEDSALSLDSAVECTSAGVFVAAYLAARNYCLFNGHTDEASYFDSLYEDAAERHRLSRRASVPPPSRRFT